MADDCPVFDVHTHIYPDAIGPRVSAEMAAHAGLSRSYDGTRAGLEQCLAAAGIAGALNAPVATRPTQVDSINAWAATQNRWPVLSFGSIHPDTPDIPTTLRAVVAAGLRGIKLHPEYQAFAPDDPRLDQVWDTCRTLGLIVLLHAGDDFAFAPPCRASPASLARLVARWPGLVVIAAHMGGFRLWDDVERELAGAPLLFDTSFGVGHMPDAQFLRLVGRHGAANILFGSDAPWDNPAATLAALRRLPLTADERRAILWGNAARLLSLPPHGAAS